MKSAGTLRILKNERGILTLDLMFALVIAFGFTTLFFALSLTLSMVEVTQYISFATARAYAGAHESIDGQSALAQEKFAELAAIPIFKSLFKAGWFTIAKPAVGDFNSEYPQNGDFATFVGARIKFTANVLNMTIPFLGSTATDSTTGVANISTYLNREVTTQECREKFDRLRFSKLKALSTDGAAYGGLPTDSAVLVTDNGC